MKFYVFYKFCELYFLFQRKFIMRRSYFLFRSNSWEKRERVVSLDFSLLSERRGSGNGARGFLFCSLEVLCGEVRKCRAWLLLLILYLNVELISYQQNHLVNCFYLHYWDFKCFILDYLITRLRVTSSAYEGLLYCHIKGYLIIGWLRDTSSAYEGISNVYFWFSI